MLLRNESRTIEVVVGEAEDKELVRVDAGLRDGGTVVVLEEVVVVGDPERVELFAVEGDVGAEGNAFDLGGNRCRSEANVGGFKRRKYVEEQVLVDRDGHSSRVH